MAVLPKPLLPLVGSNLVALALTTGGHKIGGQGRELRAYEDRHWLEVLQTPRYMIPRIGSPCGFSERVD